MNELLAQLEQKGVLLKDTHVVYTSGRHGDAYVNKDAIYPYTELTSELCRQLAQEFKGDRVDTVVAPALGGIILSQWVAFHLTQITGREVLGVYAEKLPTGLALTRGYDGWVRGRRCLVIEDILTTGGSVKSVVELVRSTGGTVVGVGALCNRGAIQKEMIGNPPRLHSLIEVSLTSWEASACPLCAKNIPLNTRVGKAKKA